MASTIVDVLVELDDGTQTTCLARIESENKNSYVVRYLTPKNNVYAYENEVYTIDKDCVSGFYDSTNEEDAGLQKVAGGWIKVDSDSEYVPSESDTDTDTSLTESEED
jgi:hypothetical protein